MTGVDAPSRDGLRLRVLGLVSLQVGGHELHAVLAQPKRLGLLFYLLLRGRGGFIRRDELLAMFWPESTESQARASLRQTLRFLRGHLGADVILNRGESEVCVASGSVSCDVLTLLDAVDTGDDRAAVDAYRGELAPSFVLAGVHDFDRWLQGERQRVRTAAVQAALRLTDEAEEAGDLPGATERARWALTLDPTNEALARRLIGLLSRAGNRADAVLVFEALRRRLAEELDLEPSAQTVALSAALLDGEDRVGADGGPARRPMSRQRVLVLGLENLTGDDGLAAVGRFIADALAQYLAFIPDIEVVPPIATFGASGSAGGQGHNDGDAAGYTDPAIELARRAGAGIIVSGTYYLDGDRLGYQVRITDATDGRLLKGPPPVHAPKSAPGEGLEELRQQVATHLAPAIARRAVHVREAARPPGMEAYSAYLEGLELFIRGDWRSALIRFRQSVALEPEYALPRIVCAIAHWNLGELPEARATAVEAAGLRASLGRFEAAILDMILAWLAGDWAAARAAARVQADLAPGSIPHFQVAEEARRLNRPREAREVLSRLEPETGELEGWIFYWIELTTAHHLMGDHRTELELAGRCRRHYPDDRVATMLEIRALAALGRSDDVLHRVDQALAASGSRPPLPGALMCEAALELRAHGQASEADALMRRAAEWYEEQTRPAASDSFRRDYARALYHAGRLDEAKLHFEELAGIAGPRVRPVGHHHAHLQAHIDEGYLAVLAARLGETSEIGRWCEWLEQLDAPFLFGAQWYWRAAVAALLGERDRAVSLLRRAFADGLPLELFLHTDPHFLDLRGHPQFDALVRPRG